MENPFETILNRLGTVEDLLKQVLENQRNADEDSSEKMFGIEEAVNFTGLKKQTIYNKVRERTIPHQRKGARLYFSSVELIEWMKSGKRKTNDEIKQDALDYAKKIINFKSDE